MKVLLACEFSGIVREAFRSRGHEAWSCDLLPSEQPSPFHLEGDVAEYLEEDWDLMIGHPPCTYLTVSGNKWMKPEYRNRFLGRREKREKAIKFFRALYYAPIGRIALENPVSILSTRFRKPDQVIQPWQFGHPETKATCLWLKNLPLLKATNVVSLPDSEKERMRLHYLPKTPDRWKHRSRTFQGIADAMASQWGALAPEG